jgi:DNA polymerase III subunit delta
VAELKPAYLVSGDDDAKIDTWRARLRRRAEGEGGAGALEVFDGTNTPAEVAAELSALTFCAGTRYLLADGAEGWKAGDLEPLEQALAATAPDTVLVVIVRGKPTQRLAKAIEKAGGELHDYAAPKPWQLPKWVVERARDEGLILDNEAAKALVSLAGPRQQRLARELEKLAVMVHPSTQLGAEELQELVAGEESRQAYDLADALVAGDARATLALAERLRSADDRPGRLIFPIVRRVRDVHRAAQLLDSGMPEQKVSGALGMPPWAAKRVLAQAKKADRDALDRAVIAFAELEIELRGGGVGLDEDTAFSLTLARATG